MVCSELDLDNSIDNRYEESDWCPKVSNKLKYFHKKLLCIAGKI